MKLMVNLGTNPTNKLQPTPSISQLTHIDISKFSQSELHSLSLFDDAAPVAGPSLHHHLQLRPVDNPSLFNDSQTNFSTPRSGRRRTRHPLPAKPPSEDPHLPENKSILKFLKDLVKRNSSSEHAGKRKRGKRKGSEEGEDGDGNGVENVYEEELSQRTVGMEGEEALLGFLRGLEGQWGSTRKKRRIVDVGLFSGREDALPAGWKLVLALRRRSGRVSVFCRRYISPSGQQFQSFKDAVQSLNSYLGLSNGNPAPDQGICRMQQSNHMDLTSPAVAVNVASTNHNVITSSALPGSSVSEPCEEKNSLLMIDDLPEVEVQALFECSNCKINFDEMKSYKNHVYLFHSKTTKLISFDTSNGRGLEIMGQKYQCELCNKLFIERSHYDSHVALHARNTVQDSEKLPGHMAMQRSPLSHTNDVMSSRFSKMDALLQIAENSLLTTSIGDTDKIDGSSSPDQLNKKETSATRFGNELSLGCCPSEKTGVIADGSLDQKHSNDNHIATHVIPLKNVGDPKSQMNESLVCTTNLKHPKHNEVGNSRNSELPIHCGISQYKPNGDAVADTLHMGQNIHHNVNSEQSLQSFPSFTAMPKGDNKLSDAHEKIEHVTDIELGINRQNPPGNSLMNGLGSPSSSEKYNNSANDNAILDDGVNPSVELKIDRQSPPGNSLMNGPGYPFSSEKYKNSANNNAILDDGSNPSVEIRSESVDGATDKRHRFITICVWCRTEFFHETADLEAITDSIGFMCPTCKQKISGHWDSGLSLNSYRYD